MHSKSRIRYYKKPECLRTLKATLKRRVSSSFLKIRMSGSARMCWGIEFHAAGPVSHSFGSSRCSPRFYNRTEKQRRPQIYHRDRERIAVKTYTFCDLAQYTRSLPPTKIFSRTAENRGVKRISVKLHLRDGRTDEQTKRRVSSSVRPFFRLSVCPFCLSGASILWGNKPPCFIEIQGGSGINQ